MTEQIKTGGPAFPATGRPDQQFIKQEGMTLHNYFYAQAMAAIISNPRLIDSLELQNIGWVVAKAKDTADLMIKARG
ncbi:TPA: hypothetical protein ACW96C_004439 [Yersinia enterocolitica]|uniref:hypothetical protein n=1 Tax=Yersinia enterocolitica TaxID=630 RepID=UPI00297807FA|nr:hypothetical protein [Yersinia enterocolitica]HDM8442167.1 hypothetical protein [Yersinia enterocolitica]HEM6609022.1 hypothetical protein [Yersinia enterocolitica]HEN3278021.1 hypothetical protein [Yersinia enterocolitica]